MKVPKNSSTIVISVSSIKDRDEMVNRIYSNLIKEPSTQFTVLKDQVNRIRILHNVGKGIKVPVRTYLVIVLPIIFDWTPLNSLFGSIDFNLEETIDDLSKIIEKLRSMQGHRVIKENSNGKSLEQLVGQLR